MVVSLPSKSQTTTRSAVGREKCLQVLFATPERDCVAFDTETTGLPWYERVIEIGAVRFRGDRVVDRWRTLVSPECEVPERAAAIHGITNQHLEGAPGVTRALRAFQQFCRGAILLAHNARFDRDVLATAMLRSGVRFFDEPVYCTWKLAKRCFPEAPRHGLAALARQLDLPEVSSHQALADAERTRALSLACFARLAEGSSQSALAALATDDGVAFRFTNTVRRVKKLPNTWALIEQCFQLRQRLVCVTQNRDGLQREISGIPTLFYAHGDALAVDLQDGPWVRTVPLAEVIKISDDVRQ
jgi:DNA polymerase III epsilon subunit family exonuclease